MTEPELLQLIEQAKREGWTEFDLSGQELTSLPLILGELHQLKVLKLGWNQKNKRSNYLTALPDHMEQLTNLCSLDLGGNKLTALPEWIAQLTNLQALNLGGNGLTALPNWMAQLTSLQFLDISRNNLKELPEWVAQLGNLQSLDISSTNLTVLPEKLAQLSNLKSLDIHSNNLTALPDWMEQFVNLRLLNLRSNSLTELPDWIGQLINLRSLDIGNANLTVLPKSLAHCTNLHTLKVGNDPVSGNKLIELPEWLAQLHALQWLDLSCNNLEVLPNWISQLSNLQFLDLRYNELKLLPEEISRLAKLSSLELGGNKLTTLPSTMSHLTSLHLLDLNGNNLTTLPSWLAKLSNLQSLNLGYTNLVDLPEWIMQFSHLQSLDLSGNRLTRLPDSMAQLSNLQWLDLSDNNLVVLPDWIADAKNLPQLRTFMIGENPLDVPPVEVMGWVNRFGIADIKAIRNYFRQMQEASSVYFYEAKLLIIGEGGSGKTSLASKLLQPDCPLPREDKSTKGIDILTWKFPLPATMADGEYQVNIWDFGGQEIYFATHQFFLTKRSVYLLVADTRRQHTDFYNWLRMQETFGGESAVLLVKNRNRQLGNSFTIENLPQLRERFPNLKEIVELDLNEVPDNSGWTDLLHHLKEYLLRLDHIGKPRPATWVAVRQAIDSDSRDVTTWSEFLTLCRAQGMKREDDIQLLGEYLHNLGDVLYFHEDAVLCDYVILKPTWGLDAVYKVLDNPQIIEQLGQFNRKNLRQLWNDPKYQGYQTQLLRLMENFQLCYPLAEVKDTYIAPQLLTEEPPNYAWESHENLQLRYVYPVFMPRGILSRAIIKLHQRIEAQRLVWRSGVILNDGYARAEVLELRGEQQIRIRVSGRNKRDLLMEIVRALDELHLGFPKLQFERRIPCNCAACQQRSEPHFYALEKLRERLANRKETIECQLPPYHEVSIRKMLDEFGDLRGNIRKREEIWDRIDEMQARSIVFNQIDTGGGPYVGGDVDTGGDFVGRDKEIGS